MKTDLSEQRNLLRDLFQGRDLDNPISEISVNADEFVVVDELLLLGWIECEGNSQPMIDGKVYFGVTLTQSGKDQLLR